MNGRSFVGFVNRALQRFGYYLAPFNNKQELPDIIADRELYSRPEDYSLLFRPCLDRSWNAIFRAEVVEHTMLSKKKLYYLWNLLMNALEVGGDVLEAGIASGGSARLMLLC